MVAVNKTRGTTVAARVIKADDFETRSRGLLDRTSLAPDEGLWIVNPSWAWLVPCPTIHTLFMKFTIDVLFLDKALRVVRVIEGLKPWRFSPWVLRAESILELAGGSLKGGVRVGDVLEIA